MSIDDRLQRALPPDAEGARDRAWAVVAAAVPAARPLRRGRLRLALAAAAAAAGAAALALSGGGAAAAEWVSDRFEATAAAPRVVVELPAAGRLLVDGPAVIREDGSKLQLPAADGATWSPHGLFIAAWEGKELRASEPDGDPRWRIEAPAPIRTAVWSPDGLRIAYLTSQNRIRIVSGNGTNDHALPRGQVAAVAPAWNPKQPQQLASVTQNGRLVVRDVGTGLAVRRGHVVTGRPESLSFSATGRWLAVVAGGELHRLDLRSGKVTREAGRIDVAAYAPSGTRLATVRGGTLSVDGRAIVTVRGTLRGLVWSPDARFVATSRGRSVLVASVDGARLVTVPGGQVRGWAPPRP